MPKTLGKICICREPHGRLMANVELRCEVLFWEKAILPLQNVSILYKEKLYITISHLENFDNFQQGILSNFNCFLFLLNREGSLVKQSIPMFIFYTLNFSTPFIQHVKLHVKIWYIFIFVFYI
jgi:hypothetical protein